jgi:outer membrane biosynthesis protein TonB
MRELIQGVLGTLVLVSVTPEAMAQDLSNGVQPPPPFQVCPVVTPNINRCRVFWDSARLRYGCDCPLVQRRVQPRRPRPEPVRPVQREMEPVVVQEEPRSIQPERPVRTEPHRAEPERVERPRRPTVEPERRPVRREEAGPPAPTPPNSRISVPYS